MRRLLLAPLLLLAACDPSQTAEGGEVYVYGDVPSVEVATYDEYVAERGRLVERLDAQIGEAPASSASACAVLPVGEKACGGPQGYRVYSTTAPAAEDAVATGRQILGLDRYANGAFGLGSDCAVPTPPRPALVGGRCVAAE